MNARAAVLAVALLALAFAVLPGDASGDALAGFGKALRAQVDDYARFRLVLRESTAAADPRVRDAARQMLATYYAIYGRPRDALATFAPEGEVRIEPPPDPAHYRAVPAVDWIERQAATRRVVMVNEAHHAPQTRLLTLALLPRLRRLGYRYLALEDLDAGDRDLATRGYATADTGFYSRDPLLALIVRRALALGYRLVAYDADTSRALAPDERERIQATNLYRRTLARDPGAKLLVHAGYAHVDKATGRLGDAEPMAMRWFRLTGIEPLSINQTQPMPAADGTARTGQEPLDAAFDVRSPTILVDANTDAAWTVVPDRNDATVLLPPTPRRPLRPGWLSLDGARAPVPQLPSPACLARLPCLLEARNAGEPDAAIPVDQVVWMQPGEGEMPLYLPPGRYRLRERDGDGATVAIREWLVPAQSATQARNVTASAMRGGVGQSAAWLPANGPAKREAR